MAHETLPVGRYICVTMWACPTRAVGVVMTHKSALDESAMGVVERAKEGFRRPLGETAALVGVSGFKKQVLILNKTFAAFAIVAMLSAHVHLEIRFASEDQATIAFCTLERFGLGSVHVFVPYIHTGYLYTHSLPHHLQRLIEGVRNFKATQTPPVHELLL